MKPKDKNRIYCVGARRPKLAFETEKKALNFIKFNIENCENLEIKPTRTYYCEYCCAWHVSSKSNTDSVEYFKRRDHDRASFLTQTRSEMAESLQRRADEFIAKIEPAIYNGEIEHVDYLFMKYDKIKLRYNLTFPNRLNKPRAEELRELTRHVKFLCEMDWRDRPQVLVQIPEKIREFALKSAANHDFILIVKKVIASLNLSAQGVDAAHKFKKSVKFCRSIIDKISSPYCETLKKDLRQQVSKVKNYRYNLHFGTHKVAS